MAFLGSGSAKLILFGEHAVVHGHPAVGTSLPGQLTVKWTPDYHRLVIACPEEYQTSIQHAFMRIVGHFDINGSIMTRSPADTCGEGSLAGPQEIAVAGSRQLIPGGLLEFESDIPVSSGLGSSGAVCVALARAVAAYIRSVAHTHSVADVFSVADAGSVADAAGASRTNAGQKTCLEDIAIWAAAHDGEGIFHGRPSGVDTGLALWERLCLFTPQPQALPSVSFLPSPGIELVYGTVPREASCAANVAAIGKAMAAGDTVVSATLTDLGRLSSQAAALLGYWSTVAANPSGGALPPVSAQSLSSAQMQPTPEAAVMLGSLANTAMGILRKLGLSTPVMDAILAAGLAAGATGGKLSGGGAGGAFWLACPSGGDATRIQTAVIEEARRLGLPGEAFTGVITI